MKDRIGTLLISIKTNNDIVGVLKSGKKINLPCFTLWILKHPNKSKIDYALLVNKTQFKLAVLRNKVKRQIRNILINSNLKGGIQVLVKPNSTYLKKDYSQIRELLINSINKYQNGK